MREAREAKAAAAAAAKGALGEDSDRGRKKVKVKVKGRIRRGQRGSSSPAARRAAGGRVVKGPLTSASDEVRLFVTVIVYYVSTESLGGENAFSQQSAVSVAMQ